MLRPAREPCAGAAEALSSSSPTAIPSLSLSPAVRRQSTNEEDAVKGAQKPKTMGKKPAQKTLKERRVEKRAAAKQTRRDA